MIRFDKYIMNGATKEQEEAMLQALRMTNPVDAGIVRRTAKRVGIPREKVSYATEAEFQAADEAFAKSNSTEQAVFVCTEWSVA